MTHLDKKDKKYTLTSLSLIGALAITLPVIASNAGPTPPAEPEHNRLHQKAQLTNVHPTHSTHSTHSTHPTHSTERLLTMNTTENAALHNEANIDESDIDEADIKNKGDKPLLEVATLAGGCFWCVEADLEKLDGVERVISGYSGGDETNPTYQEVAGGKTGHTESVQVHFDPNVISYAELLHNFWQNIDPTDSEGQFVDRGKQYRPSIFFHNREQQQAAEASKEALISNKLYSKPLTIDILPYQSFWEAEEYHQDYYLKNPLRYKFYRYSSRRDAVTDNVWEKKAAKAFLSTRAAQLAQQREHSLGSSTLKARYSKPDQKSLKERLTPLQYKVTQEDGTERAFQNEYWNEKRPGIYVDIVSGEPLFASVHKYDSKTGWPSFYQPLVAHNIVEKEDRKLFYTRTEVRSKHGDSHLGHLFSDGPEPTGQRYCINSAALRFIPKESLKEEGYTQFLSLFNTQ